jgi:hypothetical protein
MEALTATSRASNAVIIRIVETTKLKDGFAPHGHFGSESFVTIQ